ncbi:putative DNA-binding protein with PD1-like motif [Caldicoprobacter guelmensis]|uniref:PPC domain-containing DNA-binding protein n=1 Tax=Caldicoprobacter guelmensis TaxID=1170224 RepID=UPI00195AF20A|nr:PPC domain-containing DNA-binding protein [Caldicoprobacter guelmensis]MBM7583462.1 putative DNA-binding protein with PD1-like motif [Caldicoprobacter guelmensis]
MRRDIGEELGRIIILNLQRGEDLLKSIREQLKQIGIKNAVVLSAIGSLQRAVFHRVTGMEESPVDEYVTLEKPMELASLQGVIVDGDPHLHMVISDLEQTYTGHLEEGTVVLYLVEITLAEIKGVNLQRKKNELNIAVLEEKK